MSEAPAWGAALVLSHDELEQVTNGLKQPAAQLKALHAMGFLRAHRPRGGPVVLARAHYLAVEEGRVGRPGEAQNDQSPEPGTGFNVVALQRMRERKTRGQKTQGR